MTAIIGYVMLLVFTSLFMSLMVFLNLRDFEGQKERAEMQRTIAMCDGRPSNVRIPTERMSRKVALAFAIFWPLSFIWWALRWLVGDFFQALWTEMQRAWKD